MTTEKQHYQQQKRNENMPTPSNISSFSSFDILETKYWPPTMVPNKSTSSLPGEFHEYQRHSSHQHFQQYLLEKQHEIQLSQKTNSTDFHSQQNKIALSAEPGSYYRRDTTDMYVPQMMLQQDMDQHLKSTLAGLGLSEEQSSAQTNERTTTTTDNNTISTDSTPTPNTVIISNIPCSSSSSSSNQLNDMQQKHQQQSLSGAIKLSESSLNSFAYFHANPSDVLDLANLGANNNATPTNSSPSASSQLIATRAAAQPTNSFEHTMPTNMNSHNCHSSNLMNMIENGTNDLTRNVHQHFHAINNLQQQQYSTLLSPIPQQTISKKYSSIPPKGYVCRLCLIEGHWMRYCTLYREKTDKKIYHVNSNLHANHNKATSAASIASAYHQQIQQHHQHMQHSQQQNVMMNLENNSTNQFYSQNITNAGNNNPLNAAQANSSSSSLQHWSVNPKQSVPPLGYVCKKCNVPGHWIQQCTYKVNNNVPPDFYICRLCQVKGHWIHQCPNRPANYPSLTTRNLHSYQNVHSNNNNVMSTTHTHGIDSPDPLIGNNGLLTTNSLFSPDQLQPNQQPYPSLISSQRNLHPFPQQQRLYMSSPNFSMIH